MKIKKQLQAIVAAAMIFCASASFAGNAVIASGDASEDLAEAAVHLVSASGRLSAASLYLSGDVSIGLGRALGETVLSAAEISGEAVVFSAEVLAEGLITTAHLSSQLVQAGVHLSVDSALLVSRAAAAGIHISVDTAELFLDQAVTIAVASGRLSGEAADLALSLAAAGVEVSADTAVLIANAGKAGIELSEEAATGFITASLDIAAECIATAVITERYLVMTLEEANRILQQASIATVQKSIAAGRHTYSFSRDTAVHLHGLGIDAAKYAKELTKRAVQTTAATIVHTVKGTDDAVVVVINTGSGLIVATLDSLTAAVDNTANTLKK